MRHLKNPCMISFQAQHTHRHTHTRSCHWFSVFLTRRPSISSSRKIVFSLSAQNGCGMEDFFFFLPWQPLMQHRCRRWASAAAVIIRGLEGARWNVIRAFVSSNQEVLFMSSVVTSRWNWALPEMRFVYSSGNPTICRGSSYADRLWKCCQVSPSHCFQYRLMPPNPYNPTVAWLRISRPCSVLSPFPVWFLYPHLYTRDYKFERRQLTG